MIIIKEKFKFMVIDSVLVAFSLFVALLLRYDFRIPETYIELYKISVIPAILITIFFNVIFNLYKKMWRYASISEMLSVVNSLIISNLVFIFYCYIMNYVVFKYTIFIFPFTVHFLFLIINICLVGGVRLFKRITYERKVSKKGKDVKRNILVIGAGDAAAILIKEIRKHHEFNYNIVGLVDDDINKQGRIIYGIRVIGKIQDVPSIVETYNIQELIMAIPSVNYQNKKRIFDICNGTKANLKTIPGIYEIVDGKINISKIRNVKIEDLLGREEVKLDISSISEYLENKVVLVTGGGGSIGSELCRQIAKFKPKKLIILDYYENNAYDLQMEMNYDYPNLDKQIIIASVREFDRLDSIFREHKPQVVFHAAAHKHVPLMESNPEEVVKNNIFGTYNLAKCSDKHQVEKFVLISTDKAVNPTNIMGASKRFCELIIQAYKNISKTEFVAVRFGNVLGSNGSVIPLFKKQISQGGPVTVTHPEINRFFMTIPEAAKLVIQAGAIASGGEIFVLDMGKPIKIADLAKDLILLSGFKPDEDIMIEYTGLRPGEKLYEELLMTDITLTATEHKMIFIEKPLEVDLKFIESSIEKFKRVLETGKPEDVFNLMEEKVTTYNRKTQTCAT